MRNYSNENEFDLHENGRVGFVRGLVLTQRQKVTRKWPIRHIFCLTFFFLRSWRDIARECFVSAEEDEE